VRLRYLWVNEFKNLRDFEIEFNKDYSYSIIVGKNDTGKSNLLELIVYIFSSIEKKKGLNFAFKIEYTCNNSTIRYEFNPAASGVKTQILVDNKSITQKAFFDNPKGRLLPGFVFGYYSGPSNRFEQYFYFHQKKFDEDLREGIDSPERRFFSAELVHSQFVLLAFYASRDLEMRKFLNETLNIDALIKVDFFIKEPYWYKTQKREGRYWGAKGKVRDFLDDLHNWAGDSKRKEKITHHYNFRNETKINCDVLSFNKEEWLISFADDVRNRGNDFFKMLESTYMSDILYQVRITVRLKSCETITFTELSEGEQQLLVVLGLLRFTSEDESIFLLDEPDTHLNPAWSIQYEDFINLCAGEQNNSHIILATHDPLMITNLESQQVNVLLYDTEKMKITAHHSLFSPKEMGVDGLLKSELWGLNSTIGKDTLNMIMRRAVLIGKESRLTEAEKKELLDLTQKIERMGFAKLSDDPIYERYLKAISKHPLFEKPVLSYQEIEEQESKAKRILDEILKDCQ
jgi:predicted ATPase